MIIIREYDKELQLNTFEFKRKLIEINYSRSVNFMLLASTIAGRAVPTNGMLTKLSK